MPIYLQDQFLTGTNLPYLFHNLFAPARVDEITELGQLFEIDI
jgi:hypothetical protein